MATVRKIVREKKLLRINDAERRQGYKDIMNNQNSTAEEVRDAMLDVQKLKRNGSKVRRRKRCGQCGRPHGVYRFFKLCRLCLRESVHRGEVPMVVKSS